jgi:hypothetical protein
MLLLPLVLVLALWKPPSRGPYALLVDALTPAGTYALLLAPFAYPFWPATDAPLPLLTYPFPLPLPFPLAVLLLA